MIPVLIVLGSAAASAAGLFVGAAATAAAHEVVQESKDELNAINADMQKMTEDANSAIASCKETYSVSMEKFDDARTNAYLSVLPEFTQVMSNIKHSAIGWMIYQNADSLKMRRLMARILLKICIPSG